MRWLIICFILLTVAKCTQFGDFCKQYHQCSIQSNIPTKPENVIDYKTIETQHNFINNTFTYFTNVTYVSSKAETQSNNDINIVIKITNISTDPCDFTNCWMRWKNDTNLPIYNIFLSGYYDIVDNVLIMIPEFSFTYPEHNTKEIYKISFITCIINPQTPYMNYCLDYNSCKTCGHAIQFKRKKFIYSKY